MFLVCLWCCGGTLYLSGTVQSAKYGVNASAITVAFVKGLQSGKIRKSRAGLLSDCLNSSSFEGLMGEFAPSFPKTHLLKF